jgi:hypothetical protein
MGVSAPLTAMNLTLQVRVTRKARCREGFYLLINGSRLRYTRKALALAELRAWLKLQRVRILTVREYADENRKRIARQMPKG